MVDIGETVGRYRIEGEVGSGGFGVVYRASDLELDRPVALKLLRRGGAGDRASEDRFVREARAMAAVNHPNVLTIHEIQRIRDHLCLVTEFIDGETLEQRLERRPLDVPELLNLARPLLEALRTLHDKGIVHRDIKPANIMITGDGIVKLMDFGIATGGQLQKVTQTGTVSGTFGYMSPEQLRGTGLDARSDLFSAGAVFYECLTGSMPFRGESATECIAATLTKSPPSIRTQTTGVPAELESAILKALEKDPAKRFADAARMRAEFNRIDDDLRGATAVRAPDEGVRLSRRSLLAVAAAAVVVVTLAVLAVTGAFRSPELELAVRVFRSDAAGAREELPDRGVVREGDRLTLELEASQPFHLYLLHQDSEGTWYRLFPDDDRFDLRNPLRGETAIQIPPSRALRVDHRPGIETFWFLATPEPYEDLESEIRSMHSIPDSGDVAAIDPRAVARVQEVARLRGFTLVEESAPDVRPVSTTTQEAPEIVESLQRGTHRITGRSGISVMRILDHR